MIKKGTTDKESAITLQTLLNEYGCNLVVDGDFGKKTKRCVKKFQSDNDLVVDGKVGANTWKMLEKKSTLHSQETTHKISSKGKSLYKRLKKGTTVRESVILLQTLLNEYGCNLVTDGDFGNKTDACVKKFQRENNLVVDGEVAFKTWTVLQQMFPTYFQVAKSKFLSESDLENAANLLDVDVATIKAVNRVESSGSGFSGDKPKILFEGHVFWRRLEKHGINPRKHLKGNADILYHRWTRRYYKQNQYARLEKAERVDKASALESASWGLFQIMGYHWRSLGYASVQEFVDKMYKSEGDQLEAFVRFIQANNLAHYLRDKDWAGFARRYNGAGYKANKYDTKMARAYERFSNF